MTERLKLAAGSNVGHVITVVLTFSALCVAYGKLEQRQNEQERRLGKAEESIYPQAAQIARMEGKIDILLSLSSAKSTVQK